MALNVLALVRSRFVLFSSIQSQAPRKNCFDENEWEIFVAFDYLILTSASTSVYNELYTHLGFNRNCALKKSRYCAGTVVRYANERVPWFLARDDHTMPVANKRLSQFKRYKTIKINDKDATTHLHEARLCNHKNDARSRGSRTHIHAHTRPISTHNCFAFCSIFILSYFLTSSFSMCF